VVLTVAWVFILALIAIAVAGGLWASGDTGELYRRIVSLLGWPSTGLRLARSPALPLVQHVKTLRLVAKGGISHRHSQACN
jgi:hypothetical protein